MAFSEKQNEILKPVENAPHPGQFVRRQNIRHDFRLRLRAEIAFTVKTDADVVGVQQNE